MLPVASLGDVELLPTVTAAGGHIVASLHICAASGSTAVLLSGFIRDLPCSERPNLTTKLRLLEVAFRRDA